jgi:hypothetical protein
VTSARVALDVAAALGVLTLARRRSTVAVALTLVALAALSSAYLTPLPPRLLAALWLLWPAPAAALAWQVWRGRGAARVLLAQGAYAAAAVLTPWSWACHPRAWWFAQRAPFLAGAALATAAYLTRQRRERPERDVPAEPPHAGLSLPAPEVLSGLPERPARTEIGLPLSRRSRVAPRLTYDARSPGEPTGLSDQATADHVAEQVASLLTLSAVLDVTVGALGPGATWSTGLAAATWIAVSVALTRGILAPCAEETSGSA